MGYILDLAVILLFVLAIFIGYRRGFMKSILKLAGCLLSLVIAASLSGVIAGGLYSSVVGPKVEEQIVANIPSADLSTVESGLQQVLDQLPDVVTNTLGSYGVGSASEIVSSLEGSLSGDPAAIAAVISDKVVRPVAVLLIQMVTFFILFIILLIVTSILASLLSKVFNLPLLRQVNGVLGAVLGAVEGVLWVLVGVTVLQIIASSASGDALITAQTLEKSLLVGRLADINPIMSVMDSVLQALPKP